MLWLMLNVSRDKKQQLLESIVSKLAMRSNEINENRRVKNTRKKKDSLKRLKYKSLENPRHFKR